MRVEPDRNAATPTSKRSGESADTSKDSTCTISVVPTFAPSIAASAGTSATKPHEAKDVMMSAVAVLL